MQIKGIDNLSKIHKIQNLNNNITSKIGTSRNQTFENIFESAVSVLQETNQLSNAAKEAEISYALGITNSTHDLQIAQEKANIALQYTLSIRNAILESYNNIMNIQF
ncbi:MAG TPA: flagellar hook-basal body complex protein FliE [Clostridiales bacterium]|nr:flagellar hook-basal body complex protein FliE [Clostridiales bacterium]